MTVELTFLGGTGSVTGSKYLLRAGKAGVLVDCGLFRGLKALRLRNWATPPVAPKNVDAVVLTHAHLDHSGYLPRFIGQGFAGPVHARPGTRDLCAILLPDSGHLQEEEARYANERGFSKHKPALPLYIEDEARKRLKRFAPVRFREEAVLAGEFRLALQPAGHILGASIAAIQGEGIRVVFTGDLGRTNDPIMRPPRTRRSAAISTGRAQALLYFISRLKARNAIPDVPAYLNSPMTIDATRLYREYRAEHRLSPEQCKEACAVAQRVNPADESRALNRRGGPMIIVSASGMATGGRVLHHLKAFAPDARNMILLPGFQAAGTRGAALASRATEVKIHGEYVPVRAEVVKMGNMSAHADYSEILEWLRGFKRAPKRAFVTHGEPAAADEMRRLGIDTYTDPVIYMRRDCHVCRAAGFEARTRVRVALGAWLASPSCAPRWPGGDGSCART